MGDGISLANSRDDALFSAAIDRIAGTCLRPARYEGNELNASHKDWEAVLLHVALIYPDTYEVGQSGLGLKILYALLAGDAETLVERAFAPWTDMEEKLRAESLPLFSLESRRPLCSFDLVGFTLPYEMTYSNVLNMLELSRIPLLAEERAEDDPLVAGGGSCTFNPEPVAPFFDFFVIGDGEEVITEIVDVLKQGRKDGAKRHEMLRELSKLTGVYVPVMYEARSGQGGREYYTAADGDRSGHITRRVVKNLDRAFFPVAPILPYLETVHDRIMLELFRGCSRGCRFCQAGMIYRPVRERSLSTLLSLAGQSMSNTGYEEISLISLSCSDYSRIRELSCSLLSEYHDRYLEISLPSLRIDSFSVDLAKLVQRFRRTTLTFAPEVGTDRMRNIVNKGGSEQEVLETLILARDQGWKTVKLYFMTGLPGEEEEDILGINRLVWKIMQATGLRLNISVNYFIPKAWTTFQWDGLNPLDVMRDKSALMKRHLRHGKIDISFHNAELSLLEAVFARGDRKLAKVLLEAHRLGCSFDGWSDHFDYGKWVNAFESASIDPLAYTGKRGFDENLPWDHLGSREQKEFLLNDRKKADQGETVADCRWSQCSGCGVCMDTGSGIEIAPMSEKACSIDDLPPQSFKSKPVQRFRIAFTKGPSIRNISHLDLMRAVQRTARRAGVAVAYSEGFHPHMRISFGPALSVGHTGLSEWIDIDIREQMTSDELLCRLDRSSPPGMDFIKVREIPGNSEPLSVILTCAAYRITLHGTASGSDSSAAIIFSDLMNSDRIDAVHKDKKVDIRPYIYSLDVEGWRESRLTCLLRLRLGPEGSGKPADIIYELSQRGLRYESSEVERTGLYRNRDGCWEEP